MSTDLTPRASLTRETRVDLYRDGSHGVRWIVTGPEGAVAFTVLFREGRAPLAGGIDAHTPEPRYPDLQTEQDCDLLPGGRCYCDGSALQASDLWKQVTESGGDEAIWATLADRYARWIEGPEGAA